jgi:hypothetical protein
MDPIPMSGRPITAPIRVRIRIEPAMRRNIPPNRSLTLIFNRRENVASYYYHYAG